MWSFVKDMFSAFLRLSTCFVRFAVYFGQGYKFVIDELFHAYRSHGGFAGLEVRWRGFKRLTPVGEALKSFIASGRFGPVGVEAVRWDECLGRILAEDVVSPVDVPAFNRAAMDGYAVRSEDTFGAKLDKPRKLRLVGRVEMGEKPGFEVGPGEAAEISTGAMLPDGADAVLIVEHASVVGGSILVYQPVSPWRNVNRAGSDVRSGEVVLRRGQFLRPQDIGLLCLIGKDSVKVYVKPKVGILSVGSELVEPFSQSPAGLGRVVDIDRPMVRCLVERCGGDAQDWGIVGDEAELVAERLKEGMKGAHMAITTGGVSVGKSDITIEALRLLGAKILVHGVAIRPGSPVALSIYEGKPVVSLPGPPAACLIAFHLFARPVIRRLAGFRTEFLPCVRARLAARVPSRLGNRSHVRVRLYRKDGQFWAEPLQVTGSGILSTMTRSQGFVVVPEDREGLEEGEQVTVYLYTPHELVGGG